MQNTEIERKFLVVSDKYKDLSITKRHITQGYLSKEPSRTIRVRICDGRALLTIKSMEGCVGIARYEWEKEIEVEDARQMLSFCLPGVIEKTRYIVPATSPELMTKPLFWEVDVFHGRLEGLVLAELELDNEEQPYEKAEFIGMEVTGDPRYYNANM